MTRAALLVALLVSIDARGAFAQEAQAPPAGQLAPAKQPERNGGLAGDLAGPLYQIEDALIALPLAAILGAALAFRPRRRGTPPRTAAVIQTQIILAIVGAVIMLVVGASVARAFAIVGAASLIRYRSKIDDPKDAGVMLCALAIGLAAGVGLYALAVFSTLFMLAVVSAIESLEPATRKRFELHVKTRDAADLRPSLERLLRGQQVGYELRTSSQEALSYVVDVPYERRTDRISNAILRLDPTGATSVEWDERPTKGK